MCDNILCTKNLHNLYEHNDKLSNDKLMTRFIVDPFDPTLHNFLVVQQCHTIIDTSSTVMLGLQISIVGPTNPREVVTQMYK